MYEEIKKAIKIKKIDKNQTIKQYRPNKIIRRSTEPLNYENIVIASDMDNDRPLWG